jgi:hypothetical protein
MSSRDIAAVYALSGHPVATSTSIPSMEAFPASRSLGNKSLETRRPKTPRRPNTISMLLVHPRICSTHAVLRKPDTNHTTCKSPRVSPSASGRKSSSITRRASKANSTHTPGPMSRRHPTYISTSPPPRNTFRHFASRNATWNVANDSSRVTTSLLAHLVRTPHFCGDRLVSSPTLHLRETGLDRSTPIRQSLLFTAPQQHRRQSKLVPVPTSVGEPIATT